MSKVKLYFEVYVYLNYDLMVLERYYDGRQCFYFYIIIYKIVKKGILKNISIFVMEVSQYKYDFVQIVNMFFYICLKLRF